MWQKNPDGIEHTLFDAADYCENLNLAGFYDWALPEKAMLKTLRKKEQLQYNGWCSYWTSEGYVCSYSKSWLLRSSDGCMQKTSGWASGGHHARCVRGGH